MEQAFYTSAFIALTEFLKRLKAKDLYGAATIIVAGAIGAGAGYFNLGGFNVLTGLVAGLAAVGIHSVAQAAAGK